MAEKHDPLTIESQASRRIKYGLNVTIGVLAAAAIVVFVNWIGYRTLYKRFDFTATRKYTLSQQTRKLLTELEKDYRIVTLFTDLRPVHESVRDLVDEYGRYARRIDVQHIDPSIDIARHEQLFQDVLKRYENDLKPLADAVDRGQATVQRVRGEIAALLGPLKEVGEHPDLPAGQLGPFIQRVRAAFSQLDPQLAEVDRKIEDDVSHALPNLSRARSDLRGLLERIDADVLTAARDEFQRQADEPTLANALKEPLLQIVRRLQQTQDQLQKTLEAIRLTEPVESYDQVRSDLMATQSIAVLGPGGVRVIPITEMFREPDPQQVQQTGKGELSFLGEEKLTGTLLGMGLDQPPLVVFVQGGRAPAVGPGGEYEQVAQRLRSADFEVEQWNPTGQFSQQFGQPMPPRPPPEPKPGQKALWIVLPFAPANPRNPMGMANDGKQQTVDLLKRRLDEGDAAMVMLMMDPMAAFGGTNPFVEWLGEEWAITPQLDRVVLEEVRLPNRRTSGNAQINVNEWPTDLPVTTALGGMQAVFVHSSPLIVGSNDREVKHHPLVELRGQRLWAESDFQVLQATNQAKFDAATSQETFLVGVAAEKGEQRLIMVADPIWASDRITTFGFLPGLGGGPGLADIAGAAFPANSELFVNGVYWLAGLEQLIAASPRTQDIRRIKPQMNHGELVAYRWLLLAGMPVTVAIIGVGVWVVRRK